MSPDRLAEVVPLIRRAARTPSTLVEVPAHPPVGPVEPVCEVCHRRPADTRDLCTWWPAAFRNSLGPNPRRCWRCLDEDQRLDLVDAGCSEALRLVRRW